MNEIKPFAWIMPSTMKALKAEGSAMVGAIDQGIDLPLYDQQAIDTLRAEVERLRVFERNCELYLLITPGEAREWEEAEARAERAEAALDQLTKVLGPAVPTSVTSAGARCEWEEALNILAKAKDECR